ncbi:MAG: hypothetical protein KJI69_06370 [Patescibacteria group bacterium]|nr:hypothetical protein [Patescibacteria group bacterium]
MTKISERKKALEAVLEQKIKDLQQIEAARNSTVTEIVQIQGKIELLNELEHESSEENKKEEVKEDSA